jgi:hypothetical protein
MLALWGHLLVVRANQQAVGAQLLCCVFFSDGARRLRAAGDPAGALRLCAAAFAAPLPPDLVMELLAVHTRCAFAPRPLARPRDAREPSHCAMRSCVTGDPLEVAPGLKDVEAAWGRAVVRAVCAAAYAGEAVACRCARRRTLPDLTAAGAVADGAADETKAAAALKQAVEGAEVPGCRWRPLLADASLRRAGPRRKGREKGGH